MTSLVEVSEVPTVLTAPYGQELPPLLSDITLASVIKAAIETLPSIWADALPGGLGQLHLRPTPPLANVAWLRELERQDGNVLVLDRKGLTARGGLLPDDHLFKSMARNGLIQDNHVVWAPKYPSLPPEQPRGRQPARTRTPSPSASVCSLGATSPTVFNVYALSSAVCGHKGIVHGGLSSAIIDESFGYLLHLLAGAVAGAKAADGAEADGAWKEVSGLDLRSAMTAHLEVDFVQPLPADSIAVCITQVDRVEGRKVWVRSHFMSVPKDCGDTMIFATGKALFITPK